MSSLLTLSVQRSNESNNNNNSSSSTSILSPVPSSTFTSPCITPQPQAPVACKPSISLVRQNRKRPAINLPRLQLEPAIEHRRLENTIRGRDTSAHIEASFLNQELPSSPGAFSLSSDVQPSGSSDSDDSQSSSNSNNSALCSSAKYEKRQRYESTTSSLYSSVETLDSDLTGGASSSTFSSTSSSGTQELLKFLGADEYQVITYGDEFQVLEKSTDNLFQAIKMDKEKYKKFMEVAVRIESLRSQYPSNEFKKLK